MTRRKKTDGEKVANATKGLSLVGEHYLALRIDRLVRRRMAEAWNLGRTYGLNNIAADANPYRGRRRAKP